MKKEFIKPVPGDLFIDQGPWSLELENVKTAKRNIICNPGDVLMFVGMGKTKWCDGPWVEYPCYLLKTNLVLVPKIVAQDCFKKIL